MVGMGVGLKDPLHIKPLGFHPSDDLIGGFGVCLARSIVKIQNAVDDGARCP